MGAETDRQTNRWSDVAYTRVIHGDMFTCIFDRESTRLMTEKGLRLEGERQ